MRVIAPPGGKTSINLFGGYGEDPVEAPKPKVAAPAPVAVSAPSHEPFQRIVAPPGGQTSINLYGRGQPAAPQPTTAATKPTATAPPPAKAAPEPAATPFYRIMAPPGGQTSINLYGGGPPAAPQPTTAATKPTATAPPPAKVVPEPAATPFYRVMAPPGGKTSISLFGGYGEDPVAPKPKAAAPAAAAAPAPAAASASAPAAAPAPAAAAPAAAAASAGEPFVPAGQRVAKPDRFEKEHQVSNCQKARNESSVFGAPDPGARKQVVKIVRPPGGQSSISFG
ncbi:uncharacterized protein LOC134817942 isoform X2 [Bolinopsis microptera]|uniref:uncharacterized protein LOC134817942 isoform X2 n=1 Tax=Bolinopsis microptera TaxID=2820187 RepID=UPI003078DBE1